ncbi:MAG: hypothetical protein [Erysiphe necator associated deltaflexivirus 4]|nr:MAG: hypothetical protein [Erysiphe necator associated deltaflexivirus 4]
MSNTVISILNQIQVPGNKFEFQHISGRFISDRQIEAIRKALVQQTEVETLFKPFAASYEPPTPVALNPLEELKDSYKAVYETAGRKLIALNSCTDPVKRPALNEDYQQAYSEALRIKKQIDHFSKVSPPN